MNVTSIRASGAELWIIACALILTVAPLAGSAVDWQASGNDLTNDRNQPHETSIGVGNVATLKPAWTFKTLGSVSATPLVSGGYVYFPDWGGGLHKLNARTGQVAWSHNGIAYHAGLVRWRPDRRAAATELRGQARQLLSAGPEFRNRRFALEGDVGQASGDDSDSIAGRV